MIKQMDLKIKFVKLKKVSNNKRIHGMLSYLKKINKFKESKINLKKILKGINKIRENK
jgi:hypothetical protein